MEPTTMLQKVNCLRFIPSFVLLISGIVFSTQTEALGLSPIVESLEQRQEAQYIRNAPAGTDSQLLQPILDAVVSIKPVSQPESEVVEETKRVVKAVALTQSSKTQDLDPDLDLFGYDLFNTTPTTFTQINNMPAPLHYQIGIGDTLLVQLYGKKNVEYRLVVQRDGNLLVPEIGPISTIGLNFESLIEIIRNEFDKRLFGAKATVTLGEIRSIQVMITGDVNHPGRYTVSGLSTLLNGLMNSGGIRKTGSLRNIRLMRHGKAITNLDLYDILLRGDTSKDMSLKHGDVIFIPPLGPTVAIGGEVQRPAIYELKEESTLSEVIKMAGGLLATASINNSRIERISDQGFRRILNITSNNDQSTSLSSLLLKNGDLVRILPILDTYEQMILLSGNVKRPGAYQFSQGMKLSEVIPSISKLLPNTDSESGIIRREMPLTGRIKVIFTNLRKALENPDSEHNIELQQRDEVIIFKRSEDRAENLNNLVEQIKQQSHSIDQPRIVKIETGVSSPGEYPMQDLTTVKDIINLAGGLTHSVDTKYAVISRRRTGTSPLRMFSIQLDHDANKVELFAGDTLYLFERGNDRSIVIKNDIETLMLEARHDELPPIVFINGKVLYPGQYPYEIGMSLNDLIRAAGGLKMEAYDKTVEISHFVLDANQIRNTSHDIVSLNGHDGTVVELYPYDQIRIAAKPGYSDDIKVEVKGQLQFPGLYVMRENETLCELLVRAGGVTGNAYNEGAVFLRESVRAKQALANDQLLGELDDLLVQIHLSPSANNQDKMPAGEQKHGILKAIKQLKKNPAQGRMVIDLNAAHDCEHAANIVLEDGDKLYVPQLPREVSVMGQVYRPTTHLYKPGLGSRDYIDLSGGSTVLGRLNHAYVVQANGEVDSMRRSKLFKRAKNIDVMPGSTIYVPIDVDRMNGHEKAQSWTKSIFQLAVAAASLNVVGIF